MLKQYLLTALRTFWRNRVTTFINMTGLMIGVCAALVIFLIVRYDFSFDRFEPGRKRIYRVVTDMTFAATHFPNSGVPGTVPPVIASEFTGVEVVAPFYECGPNVSIGTAHFKQQEHIAFVDRHFFDLVPYRLLAGSTTLKDPYQVVLTESRAKVYFPGLTPDKMLGKVVTYDDTVHAQVTGVVADQKEISDFTYVEFISYTTLTNTSLKNTWSNDWGSITSNQQCFIRLAPGVKPAGIERQLAAMRLKYAKEDAKNNDHTVHHLQPLADVHFNSTYGSMGPRTADKTALYGLLATGIFLLLLACINYVNLTTAQAAQRAKEVGIRKTMGGTRRQLVTQFLGETFCITLVAMLIWAGLTPLLLKAFSDFIPEGVRFRPFSEPIILGFLLVLTLVVTLLAGFYPSLVLAGLKPVLVLKNQAFSGGSSRRAWLRKTLTVFQFVIAQAFVLGTLLVAKQIRYSIHKDLGYRKEAIVSFNMPWNFYGPVDLKPKPVLNEIASLPGVERASLAQAAPAAGGYSSTIMTYSEGPKEIKTDVQLKDGDSNYIPLFGLRLLAGRNIQTSDTPREFVINEKFMHALGFNKPQDAIGHLIHRNKSRIPIVGVVADFRQSSVKTPIKPIAIEGELKYAHTIHVALRPENPEGTSWKATIDGMKKVFSKFYPGEEFKYEFFDESIAKFYKSEQDTEHLLAWATGLTILISCLGLLGLVMFTTRMRIKEIGIRKVLGASSTRLVALLSGDFIRLVALAFVIAVPLAWWGVHRWLQNFDDRTPISWWVFALGGMITLVTATLTLGFQTIRAARANPVESLRSE